jgi:sugar lactone lactonase YvrE/uncharacterized protein GlcG (DUF336 family)
LSTRSPVRSAPCLFAAAAIACAIPDATAQLGRATTLSLEAAKRITDTAEREAARQGATVVIAVVDDGGHLLVLHRLDDTQVASVDVAIAKARTAAIFRRPSREFEEQIKNGRLASLVLPGAAPLQGGVPILHDRRCIGAIGVSGNTPAQDEQIAIAGASVAAGFAITADGASQPTPHAVLPRAVPLRVQRFAPSLDDALPRDAVIERVAAGFAFTEGPVWVDGGLLFSDPNRNVIHRWDPAHGVTLFLAQSGYAGADIAEYSQPGSNGLALDAQRRLTLCQHGDRRIARLEPDGSVTTVADRWEGKRFNSPNDLIYKSDGSLWFTDPPFGLPKFADDPRKELPFSGVFRVKDGRVSLVAKDLAGPNGIAFSPDERFLYVGNWDPARKVVMRYPVRADGGLADGEVLCDLTGEPGDAGIDGIEVDARGNLWVAGPGGLWVVAADGTRLGLLQAPEEPHNLAWGDADGHALYLTAQTGIYRLRVGVGAAPSATTPPRRTRP